MSDDRLVTSEKHGENQDSDTLEKNKADRSIALPYSKIVMYSHLALTILLLLGVGLVARVLVGAIGKESEKIVGATTAARDDLTRTICKEFAKTVEAALTAPNEIRQILAKDAAPAGNSAVVGAKQVAAGQRALARIIHEPVRWSDSEGS